MSINNWNEYTVSGANALFEAEINRKRRKDCLRDQRIQFCIELVECNTSNEIDYVSQECINIQVQTKIFDFICHKSSFKSSIQKNGNIKKFKEILIGKTFPWS